MGTFLWATLYMKTKSRILCSELPTLTFSKNQRDGDMLEKSGIVEISEYVRKVSERKCGFKTYTNVRPNMTLM